MAHPLPPVGQQGGLRPQDLCGRLTTPLLTHSHRDTRPVLTDWKAGTRLAVG